MTIDINEILKVGIPSIIAFLSLIFNLYQFKINQKTSTYKIIDDLRDENRKLKDDIRNFQNTNSFENKIKRHNSTYLTLDNEIALYCSVFWDTNKKMIQLKEFDEFDHELQCDIHYFNCPVCKNRDYIRPEFKPAEFAELEEDDDSSLPF